MLGRSRGGEPSQDTSYASDSDRALGTPSYARPGARRSQSRHETTAELFMAPPRKESLHPTPQLFTEWCTSPSLQDLQ